MSSDLDSQTERVRLLAIDFRKAIDHALKAGDLYRSVIASFSSGFCGYTSDLLQRSRREGHSNAICIRNVS